MKRIFYSAGVIAFIGALSLGATGAFFSDSETSTGNTFTAGAIDLTVDSEQHYNDNECVLVDEAYVWVGQSAYPVPGTPCDGTWTQTNLGITHKFFNFTDVKPGDEGENTISLHIDSNPAWVCADVNITANDDVSTVDPETDAGDATNTPALFDGELAQNIEFVAWVDMASTSGAVIGDNIWQAGEPLLFQPGPTSNLIGATTTLALADSTTGNGPLPGGATNYIGLAWCAGNLDTSVPGTITCDGSTMGNIAQTDSMVADLTFRVEQSRNNEDFTCGGGEVGPQPISWTDEGTRTSGSATVIATTTESGSNALRLVTINDVDSRVRYNYDIADIDVSAFTGFSFDSKQVSAFDPINGNASFRLVVDLDGNPLTLGDIKDVTYEPYYNILAHNSLNDAAITTGAWQNWAATMADGKFWAGGVTTVLGPSEGAGGAYATNFTIAQLLAAYPSAKITGISIGMGTYNVDQVVLVDNLIFNGNVLGFE